MSDLIEIEARYWAHDQFSASGASLTASELSEVIRAEFPTCDCDLVALKAIDDYYQQIHSEDYP